MQLYGQEPIKVRYRLAKFGGHRHCGSEVMILVCHVICKNILSKSHVTLWGGARPGKLPSCQVWRS